MYLVSSMYMARNRNKNTQSNSSRLVSTHRLTKYPETRHNVPLVLDVLFVNPLKAYSFEGRPRTVRTPISRELPTPSSTRSTQIGSAFTHTHTRPLPNPSSTPILYMAATGRMGNVQAGGDGSHPSLPQTGSSRTTLPPGSAAATAPAPLQDISDQPAPPTARAEA